MKRKLLLTVATSMLVLGGCNQKVAEVPQEVMVLDTQEKKVSYGMGVGLGERIKNETFSIDINAFTQGLRNVVEDGERLMTQEEIMAEMKTFQQQQIEKQKAEQENLAASNKTAGDTFLAENKAKEGVTTTESGLQYKVVTEGSGAKPTGDDTVEVHYSGTLLDGTVFDSSYKRGAPVTFPVRGVIPGWTEALQLMPVGSKWQLFIPSNLAYGPGGTGGGPIGPNAALIFDVELISIKAEEKESEKES